MTLVAIALLGAIGLLVGSFLNVVIHRVPLGTSVARPRSACPHCGHPIRARDNVPVASWVLLRGRCRDCRAPIPGRYPLVELATGAVWVGLGSWATGPGDQIGLLPWLLVLGSAGIALVVIDAEHHRLPNVIVLPLYPAGVIGLALAGLIGGRWPIAAAAVGAGIWLAVIGGLWAVSRGRGMGFGDVKLAPVLGVTLGWVGVSAAVVGLGAAFVAGGIFGAVLLLSGRAGRGTHLAFGPFLIVGAAVGLVLGPPVARLYLGA
ncbi:MAG: prepilin peptidase [Actinomycetota bacterium]|nr:prepilin peptidase [Actinomycetota bacterium]